jgi:diphosphomevalonate decarboxylase
MTVAQAQPNIALITYWGKQDRGLNLPATGSLSLTLESRWTRMGVRFEDRPGADRLTVNGVGGSGMLRRVTECLDRLCGGDRPAAIVESTSNFPIGAGLASSASAFAALVTAASAASKQSHDRQALARLAGGASGSAARSLYAGIVELAVEDGQISVGSVAAIDHWSLRIVVAITDESAKPIGSGEAMLRSASSSPFYSAWVERQNADLEVARSAVLKRDFEQLAAVSEHNCLKMHSVTWTSRPAIVYWNAPTVACMQAVRGLQKAGVPVFFTIDAGPQVKAVCLPGAEEKVVECLSSTSGVRRVLTSGLGDGARVLA